jgi:hypothetical protein
MRAGCARALIEAKRARNACPNKDLRENANREPSGADREFFSVTRNELAPATVDSALMQNARRRPDVELRAALQILPRACRASKQGATVKRCRGRKRARVAAETPLPPNPKRGAADRQV